MIQHSSQSKSEHTAQYPLCKIQHAQCNRALVFGKLQTLLLITKILLPSLALFCIFNFCVNKQHYQTLDNDYC